ncbi:hypothetical protein CYG48_00710 [Neorhizobium sp. SOG26]|nr:hypothetical protein CYG48_00710 [Neorhizobium sp. SOG26]
MNRLKRPAQLSTGCVRWLVAITPPSALPGISPSRGEITRGPASSSIHPLHLEQQEEDGDGCDDTPLCPAGHLPLKGEITRGPASNTIHPLHLEQQEEDANGSLRAQRGRSHVARLQTPSTLCTWSSSRKRMRSEGSGLES